MLKTKKSRFKRVVLILLAMGAISIFAGLGVATVGYITTPLDKSKLVSTNIGVEIYDTASTTTPIYYSSDKKIISSSYLQPHTLNAFIAIEDKRFYTHNGYDLKRIVKAMLVNLKSGSKSQGASTITQQLIKNTLLNSEKTYSRKFKEIVLSIKTEKNFSKEEILNMYLNSIYFGSNAYGIENASNLYFNKSASELTVNESACLAGIIKSPTYYSPINHPDKCFERKNLVLKQMLINGYISQDEYDQNVNMPIQVSVKKNNYDNSYNQQVIIEACELLNITEKELLRQELKIYTYLDNDIQQNIEQALLSSDFNKDKLSLVADCNGRVLGFYGDSYFDLSQMRRSPASTVKPLIIYLPAVADNVVSPASPILDEPLTTGYCPKNAGDKYLGWTNVRTALSQSSNVCAVKMLNQIGINTANEYGFKLGLFNNHQSNTSLALGDIGGGVKVLDLARAYSVLQNNGIDKGLTFISRIEDKFGKTIYQDSGYNNTLFKPEDCMLINDMLKTCASSGTAKRLNDLPFEVASKTGTAQNNDKHTDLWNIAYTTQHLTLTWCGDATSQGLDREYSSGFYPTMINKSILKGIYSNYKPNAFKFNENIVKVAIDSIEYQNMHTLSLAPDNALERYKLYDIFKADNIPTTVSSTYSAPQFNLAITLTTKGAQIKMDTNLAYVYQVFAIANNTTRLIGEYMDEMYDEKVFNASFTTYYAVAVNRYTNQRFTSNKISINAEEYLVEMLNNNFIAQNQRSKTKWYV